MNVEPVKYTELIHELKALLDEKRKYEHDETNARNAANDTAKRIEAKRKEISKAVLAADRDLGAVIGSEYGMVYKSANTRVAD